MILFFLALNIIVDDDFNDQGVIPLPMTEIVTVQFNGKHQGISFFNNSNVILQPAPNVTMENATIDEKYLIYKLPYGEKANITFANQTKVTFISYFTWPLENTSITRPGDLDKYSSNVLYTGDQTIFELEFKFYKNASHITFNPIPLVPYYVFAKSPKRLNLSSPFIYIFNAPMQFTQEGNEYGSPVKFTIYALKSAILTSNIDIPVLYSDVLPYNFVVQTSMNVEYTITTECFVYNSIYVLQDNGRNKIINLDPLSNITFVGKSIVLIIKSGTIRIYPKRLKPSSNNMSNDPIYTTYDRNGRLHKDFIVKTHIVETMSNVVKGFIGFSAQNSTDYHIISKNNGVMVKTNLSMMQDALIKIHKDDIYSWYPGTTINYTTRLMQNQPTGYLYAVNPIDFISEECTIFGVSRNFRSPTLRKTDVLCYFDADDEEFETEFHSNGQNSVLFYSNDGRTQNIHKEYNFTGKINASWIFYAVTNYEGVISLGSGKDKTKILSISAFNSTFRRPDGFTLFLFYIYIFMPILLIVTIAFNVKSHCYCRKSPEKQENEKIYYEVQKKYFEEFYCWECCKWWASIEPRFYRWKPEHVDEEPSKDEETQALIEQPIPLKDAPENVTQSFTTHIRNLQMNQIAGESSESDSSNDPADSIYF